MCTLLGIDKSRTTPWHPQSDGMVERFNRSLEIMLREKVAEDQLDWDDHIDVHAQHIEPYSMRLQRRQPIG